MNPQFYLHWYWRFGEVVLQLGRSFIFPESQFSPSLIPLFTGHNHLKFSRSQKKQMPQFQRFSEEPTSTAPHPIPVNRFSASLRKWKWVGETDYSPANGAPLAPTGFPVILWVAKTPWRLSATFVEKLNSYLKSFQALGRYFWTLKNFFNKTVDSVSRYVQIFGLLT